MKKAIILLMIISVFLTAPVAAQAQQSSFTECSCTTSQLEKFQYWLYTPENPTENMPLIVYLHGGSGKGSDLSLITAVDGFPKYLQDGQLGNLRAYVIIPQLPADQTGWSSVGASLMQLISSTVETYSLDSGNISLTGHSMGGTGTWSMAAAYPSTFARIAPLSGSVKNTTLNVNKLKNVPVRAYVGSADTIVAPEASQNFIAALRSAGADAQITTFDGATHFDVPALVYLDSTIGILNWLIDARFAACDSTGQLCCSASLQDAMANGDYVTLLQDAEVNAALDRDLYLDTNGHSISGVMETGGFTVYGMDSTTNQYSAATVGSFSCVTEQGETVEPAAYFKTDITGQTMRYLTVQQEDGYSFHRFYLGVTHMSLKPTTAGVGYKAVFWGDEMVAANLNSFGFTMCLEGNDPVTVSKAGENFVSGKVITLRVDNFDVERYGETVLSASVMIKLADGTVIESTAATMTFRGLMEQLNTAAGSLTEEQLTAIAAMIEKHVIIKQWATENLYTV